MAMTLMEISQHNPEVEYVVTYIDGHSELVRFKTEAIAIHHFLEEDEWISSYKKI